MEELGLGLRDPAEILAIDTERAEHAAFGHAGGEGELAGREHQHVVLPDAVIGRGRGMGMRAAGEGRGLVGRGAFVQRYVGAGGWPPRAPGIPFGCGPAEDGGLTWATSS